MWLRLELGDVLKQGGNLFASSAVLVDAFEVGIAALDIPLSNLAASSR